MIKATTGATYTDCMKYFIIETFNSDQRKMCGDINNVKYYCEENLCCIQKYMSCMSRYHLYIGTSYEQPEYKTYQYDAYLEKDS